MGHSLYMYLSPSAFSIPPNTYHTYPSQVPRMNLLPGFLSLVLVAATSAADVLPNELKRLCLQFARYRRQAMDLVVPNPQKLDPNFELIDYFKTILSSRHKTVKSKESRPDPYLGFTER